MTDTEAPAPLAPVDCPAGYRWLPDAVRQGDAGVLTSALADGSVTAIIRTPFADRYELPAAFWRDGETADAAAQALAKGWLRIPRPRGWCKWIEGHVWVPDPDRENQT